MERVGSRKKVHSVDNNVKFQNQKFKSNPNNKGEIKALFLKFEL
jgi:hypothetical protein